jgi:hypothetical protein
MIFEANQGQTAPQVRFLSHGNGYALFLTPSDAVLSLTQPRAVQQSSSTPPADLSPTLGAVLDIQLLGGSTGPSIAGLDELPSKSNYLQSNDPSQWHVNVPNFGRVEYQDVYLGVDLIYHGTGRQLEYDFVIRPGGDPNAIHLHITGASSMELDAGGDLVLHTVTGDVVEHAPVLYQDDGSARQPVAGHYVLDGDGVVSFSMAAYDARRPLIIDPILSYSTYLGNSTVGGTTNAASISVDKDGNAYITGSTSSLEFPTTSPTLQSLFISNVGYDAFVTKLNAAGQPVYSTYLGGVPDESGVHQTGVDINGLPVYGGFQWVANSGTAIAVDGAGNVCVAGDSQFSGPFLDDDSWLGFSPLVNAFQPKTDHFLNAFVAKLDPTGSQLIYSSYVGADTTFAQFANGIAVDKHGNAYVVGRLAVDASSDSAFVAKVSPDGVLGYMDSFGGDPNTSTSGIAIAVDPDGNAYLTGYTNSPTFATQTPVPESLGKFDGFVGHLDPGGGVLGFTRLGGSQDDFPTGIALDSADDPYITGSTASYDFPTTANAFQTINPWSLLHPANFAFTPTAFVTKLNADLSRLIYSTYLGGSHADQIGAFEYDGGDRAHAIAVDANGAAYVVGMTSTIDFPTVNAFQPQHSTQTAVPPNADTPSPFDAFVTELDPSGSGVLYSTYLGDTGYDSADGVAVDAVGNVFVAGTTGETHFPTSEGALQLNYTVPPDIPYYGAQGEISLSSPSAFTSGFEVRFSPPLRVIALPVKATVDQPFSGPVASFTSPDLKATPSKFTANINWGDGITDLNANITQPNGPGTPFLVDGSHIYTSLGSYPIVVSVNDPTTTAYDVSQLIGEESEPTIAIDPTNPKRMFASSPSSESFGKGVFAAYSVDGGVTWTPSNPSGSHVIATGTDVTAANGDVRAVFDKFGNLFLTYLSADLKTIVVAVSTDGGRSFTRLTEFASASGSGISGTRDDPEDAEVDQPNIAVGPGPRPGTGSVWISYADAAGEAVYAAGAEVDGLGATAVGPFAVIDVSQHHFGNFGDIAVGPRGEVAVAWQNFDPDDPLHKVDAIVVSTNSHGLDDPSSFSTPIGLEPRLGIEDYSIPPQQTRKITAKIQLAWDQSGKAHNGRLYMCYTDAPDPTGAPNDTNIYIRYSDDNGLSWTNPRQVNDDQTQNSQFNASIAVDQSTGDVGLSWYDARDDAADQATQVFAAVSGDGGVNFSSNVVVSAGPSNATSLNQGNQYGDYEGLVFANGFFYPIWTDNSKELTGNPDPLNGSFRGGFDIAVARIAVADVIPPKPKVSVTPPSLNEGQTFQGVVATFSDPDQNLTATDFTVTIDWADGTPPSVVTPTGDVNNGYVVRASHTYAEEGGYPIQVTVHDNVHNLDGKNQSAVNISMLAENQVEGTITINPKDPTQLFAASNNESGGIFVATSIDGGDTWSGRTAADGADGLPLANGDPIAAFDQYGNLFLTYLTPELKEIVVALSTDNGQHFTVLQTFSDPAGVDKPALAVGPGPDGKDGSVWVTYVNLASVNAVFAAGAMVTDKGQVGPFSDPESISDHPGGTIASLVIDQSGDVLVVFQSPNGVAGPSAIYASLDKDGLGPEGFSPSIKVSDINIGDFPIPAQATRKIHAGLNVAIDLSDNGHKGRIYVVYTDSAAVGSAVTNIFVRFSDDDGKTWSDPVLVNDDNSTSSKFFPSIAVDQGSGNVGVSWYDTRNDPENIKAQFFAAVSAEGGTKFSTNIQVSPGSSDATNPGLSEDGKLNQFGDYAGLAFFQNTLYPLWSDNSADLETNPDQPQFEQATAHISVANVADLPLSADPLDISADVQDEGQEFTADLAEFTDPDPGAKAEIYSATIDWGDKTDPATGTVREDGGKFIVSGKHAYEEEGSYTITVSIKDKGGASAKVTLDADIEDGQIKIPPFTFKPVENLPYSGPVATFTDDDPNGQPDDYVSLIDWGDGAQSPGQVVFAGSEDLAFNGSLFYAIGSVSTGPNAGQPYLFGLDSTAGAATALFQVGSELHGGMAFDTLDASLYAISNVDGGESFLNRINVNFQTVQRVAYLGTGFTGGLTFDQQDGLFYAIDQTDQGTFLDSIDPRNWTVQQAAELNPTDPGFVSFSGLAWGATYPGSIGPFYAIGNDDHGASTLYTFQSATAPNLVALFKMGMGYTGGLVFSVPANIPGDKFGLIGRLDAIAGDGSGSAVLNAISPDTAAITTGFEVGSQFNDGFFVVGSHTYANAETLPVSVHIVDVGGSKNTSQNYAQVIDEPPIALSPPPDILAFQGFATGPLTLAQFSVPHGAATGANVYSAKIDWGDGSEPDVGSVAVSGTLVTVSAAGHAYTAVGTMTPGAKTGAYHPVVTLTDDTGNSSTVTATIDIAPDVTARVHVVDLGGPQSPAGVVTSSGTITNVSNAVIPGPLYLVVRGLPAGVTLANETGTLFSGDPFVRVDVAALNGVQESVPATLQFSDPGLIDFSYSITVIDGPFGSTQPSGANAASSQATAGFLANQGQADPQARFLSQGNGYSLFLTDSEAVLALQGTAIHMQLAGANADVVPVGAGPLPGRNNFIIGNDPSKWQMDVPSYSRVEYRDIYRGITLDYHSTGSGRLEYDLTVDAGADPSLIHLHFTGAESMTLDASGNLVLHTPAGDLLERAPVMYQRLGSTRRAVAGGYVIGADGQVHFSIGAYDPNLPLIIDPVLDYSTYLGGSSEDVVKSVATDSAGNVYLTGYTYSADFPTLGALGAPPARVGDPFLFGGGEVAFVTKLDPAGGVVYSTYIGGSGIINIVGGISGERGLGIAVDAVGEAYVTGLTPSIDFPTINALDAQGTRGQYNGFLFKLDASGSHLMFSTYLTGTLQGSAVALDPAGNVYVAGRAADNFPVRLDDPQQQEVSGFVEKFTPAGDQMIYAASVPGTEARIDPELGFFVPTGSVTSLAVDAADEVYVTGQTFQQAGPIHGAVQPTFGGGSSDAFVAKFSPDATSLLYWTYLGGSQDEIGNAIAVDADGNAYIAGTTRSSDFPIANAAQTSFGGGAGMTDAFVAKLGPDGSSLAFSSYLGSSGPDTGNGVALDLAGNIYVTGQSGSGDFPTLGALQTAFGGDVDQGETSFGSGFGQGDAFVTSLRVQPGGTLALNYSTFLGGSGTDGGNSIAVTPAGDAVVGGFTTSTDFPTLNATQPQAGVLSGFTYFSTPDTGNRFIAPAAIAGRTSLGVPTAFVAKIAAEGPGTLQLKNVPFHPIEAEQFTGTVATFTDTDADAAEAFTSTVDWGDGTTSSAAVASDSVRGHSFTVSATHTYAEDGSFAVSVLVHDADGSTATADGTTFSESAGGPVTYHVSVDTSALAGINGFLDFQLNPGAAPGAQQAHATIQGFQSAGGVLAGVSTAGTASGSLTGSADLENEHILNELKQGFTFGTSLSFTVQLDGDALSIPGHGLFGSTFGLTLYGPDGQTPLQTTAIDGAIMRITVNPDGATQFISSGSSIVQATAVSKIGVADAPLAAKLVAIQAVEGTPFSGKVATFTDPNNNALASDFTASILWGDGSGASTGTVIADGPGSFHVVGTHTYVDAGPYVIRVVIRDKDGSAAAASTAPTQIGGLQGARMAVNASNVISFVAGDFNGDGRLDLVVVGILNQFDPNPEKLFLLQGRGDGSFGDPIIIANSDNYPIIATGDFNGDGKLDFVTGSQVFLGNGDGTFQAPLPLPSPLSTSSAVVADFNGDGIPDLASGTNVLLGHGDGTFAPPVLYAAGLGGGASVVAGDFTGDRKIDLVFSTSGAPGQTATVGDAYLLPNNGDGTFGTPVLLATNFAVTAAVDLNGDGKLDVVGIDSSQVRVMLGNGDGTFGVPVNYDAGNQPGPTMTGDFDGNGTVDIAVIDSGAIAGVAGLTILRGNGDGTFAAPLTFSTPPLYAPSTGDFNGDGKLDLAFASQAGVGIFFGQGNGTLAVASDTLSNPHLNGFGGAATADFNGDGRADVAFSGDGSVTVLSSNGDGNFETAGALTAGGPILAGDINGDGKLDLVIGSQLFLGNGDGTYRPAIKLPEDSALALGDFNHDGKPDLLFSSGDVWLGNGDGTFTKSAAITVDGGNIYAVAVADLNGDGIDDLVVFSNSLQIFIANGDGTFQAKASYNLPVSNGVQILVADLNHDGKLDLVVNSVGQGVFVLLGNGDGSFQDPVNVFTSTGNVSFAMGDFNGDGNQDLVVADESQQNVTVLLGNGDGSFVLGSTVATGLEGLGGIVAGDFNGDGRLDFATADSEVSGLHLFLGNGDGTFQPGAVYAPAGSDAEAGLSNLTALDLNNDGRLDLLAESGGGLGDNGSTTNIFLALADGSFRAARMYGVTSGPYKAARFVNAADLNRDGRPDIVGVGYSTGRPFVLLNRGDGTFANSVEYDFLTDSQRQQGFVPDVTDFIVGDFNNDGIPDLLADVADAHSAFAPMRVLLLGNGDGTFQAPLQVPLNTFYFPNDNVVAADVNGDGNLDLVGIGSNGTDVEVDLGNGDGTFQPPISTGPLDNVNQFYSLPYGFAVADFNGDAKLDVVIAEKDGSLAVLPGNGDGTFGAPIHSAGGMQSLAFAAADVDGDGKADLVTTNFDGTVSYLRGNGDGTFQRPINYLFGSSANAIIGAIELADVNGDGSPDVVAHSESYVAVLLNFQGTTSSQNVIDAPLTATGLNHLATQGVQLNGIVARFTDGNPLATVSDYTATISWGDGQTSSGTIQSDGKGGFVVLGSNVFAQAGTYTASVVIADKDGSMATVHDTISVSTEADAALSAAGQDISATALVPFSGVLATFVDQDPAGNADDFTATIDWGDGSTSLGFVRAASGGFEIDGTHSYVTAGNFTTTASIVDTAGSSASATGTATVVGNTDLPLTPTALTFNSIEQTEFSGTVATFTDADPEAKADDYTAQIDWGDGFTTQGTIQADSLISGQFDVVGDHTYSEEGTIKVTVAISDAGGASANVASTANVADAPLAVSSAQVSATEGSAFTGVVATFTDANPFSTVDDFAVTITWGDGQTSSGQISADPSIPGMFEVTGTNSYAQAGVYKATAQITDKGLAVAQAETIALVSDAGLAARGNDFQAAAGSSFTGIVAKFTDQNPNATASDFLASIIWGDGLASTGIVSADPAGGFEITGSHTYSVAGAYLVSISIVDSGGARAGTSATATISEPAIQGDPVPVSTLEGAKFSGIIATFATAPGQQPSSDFVVSIDWGDGSSALGNVVVDPSTGVFDIAGTTTYAEEGIYTITATVRDLSGIVASISIPATVDDAQLTGAPSREVRLPIPPAILDPDQGDEDAPPTFIPVNIEANTGVMFSDIIVTFTDADPAGTLADYTATIDWGNGQTSTGTVNPDAAVPGQFDVTGSVIYADRGIFPVIVTINDVGGASVSLQMTARVTNVPTAAGTLLNAQASVPFSTAVATIADGNPEDDPADFTATIDWGDGHMSTGLVTHKAGDPNSFEVLGTTVYAGEGSHSVNVQLVRKDGLALQAQSTVTVSSAPDAPLTSLPAAALSGKQNIPMTVIVAEFQDGDTSSTASVFTATIDWGDGTSSTGSVEAAQGAPGFFRVVGSHIYRKSGTFAVRTAINDSGGAGAEVDKLATIMPGVSGRITASGMTLSGFERQVFDGTVATFTDSLPSVAPSDFTITINWGDGSSSSGNAVAATDGFAVHSSHAYLDEGHFTVTVQIADPAANSASVASNALILEELLPGGVRGTPNQRYVSELYRDMLRRQVGPMGLAFWSGLLDQGVSRFDIVLGIENSIEYKTDVVQDMYHQFLYRDADSFGLHCFVRYLQSGGSQEQVEALILNSPEYFQSRAKGTNGGFLDALYRDVFSRSLDPVGTKAFGSELAAGVAPKQIADQIFSSAEYRLDLVTGYYARYLDRELDPTGRRTWTELKRAGASNEAVLASILSEKLTHEFYDKTLL